MWVPGSRERGVGIERALMERKKGATSASVRNEENIVRKVVRKKEAVREEERGHEKAGAGGSCVGCLLRIGWRGC